MSIVSDHVGSDDNDIMSHTEKSNLLPGDGEVEEIPSGCCSALWRKFWVCTAALMAYSAAFIIYWPLTQQYVYHRIATEKFGNASAADSAAPINPCFENSSDPSFKLQMDSQAETSRVTLYLTLASAVPATLVSLIFGSYSDYLGRRLLFFVPLVGNLLRSVLSACVIHFNLNIYILIAGNFVEGVTGSFFVVILAGFAFTADITPPTRTRTVAMAALEAMFSLVSAGAQVGSGYLINAAGFLYPILVSVGLVILSIFIVLFIMKETVTTGRHKTSGDGSSDPYLSPWTHLKKSLSFYFTGKSGRVRAQFALCLLMFLLVSTCGIGRIVIEPLYQLNSPFCWDSVRIGIYGAARTVCMQTLGTLLIKLLYVCMYDELIAVLSLLLSAGSFVLEAFATTDLMMYLVPAVGITSVTPLPILRSIMSRMASPEEQGAILSSVAAVETFCQSIASLLINLVYENTLHVFPGTVFLVMGGLIIITVLCLGIFVVISRKR